jgi:nitroreductase
MKHLALFIIAVNILSSMNAQELKPITLLAPDKTRGSSLMQALDVRASTREWSSNDLSLRDLSDVIWAANGINRPTEGKRTASSAMNAQDVDIYVFMKEGVFLYDAVSNLLNPVVAGNFLDLPGKTDAPVNLVLITDISKFGAPPASGAPAGAPPAGRPSMNISDSLKIGWANLDAGIVSQNISLFCAATGLKTRPRASFPGMDKAREVLKLKSSQYILLNHPVGYSKVGE